MNERTKNDSELNPKLELTEIKRNLGIAFKLFLEWFTAPVDAISLRVFEVAFTFSFTLLIGFNLVEWEDWLTSKGFHLTVEESMQLGYPPAMPLLKVWHIIPFCLVLVACVLGVTTGKARRISLIGLFGIALYTQAVDYLATSAQNRICIAVFALLATGPSLKMLSSGLRVSRVLPMILRLTLVIIYFDAGFTKAFNGGAWLAHDDCLKLALSGFHRTELASKILAIVPDGIWAFSQYCVLTFEMGAPFFFFFNRTRLGAVFVGCIIHLLIALLMMNVWFLSLQTACFYILFLSPASIRNGLFAVNSRIRMKFRRTVEISSAPMWKGNSNS